MAGKQRRVKVEPPLRRKPKKRPPDELTEGHGNHGVRTIGSDPFERLGRIDIRWLDTFESKPPSFVE